MNVKHDQKVGPLLSRHFDIIKDKSKLLCADFVLSLNILN